MAHTYKGKLDFTDNGDYVLYNISGVEHMNLSKLFKGLNEKTLDIRIVHKDHILFDKIGKISKQNVDKKLKKFILDEEDSSLDDVLWELVGESIKIIVEKIGR